ncbi:DUF4959 domain-containing protein [uncultured Alistipes sp.]|uniref:DUF4959 domain-containing protein n=1 Tax=uncultured Alistipes sp. TaxID=538949 RepID=UPI00261BCC5A|nr:DUF4959 domain-containing protein [uncultured Alistipes sp.]
MKTSIFVIALFAILSSGCSEDKLEPMGHNSTPPGTVSDIRVENQPGQVKITYKLPADQDLLYVKAVYKLNSGATREIKASYYTNTMILDGFGDTDTHDVSVYAVNRSEVASEPVTVQVKPLENPIWGVRRSLNILPDFSGMQINAENPTQQVVAIEIMQKDSLGKWQYVEGVESSQPQIQVSKRGLDTLDYEFRFTVRDRFLNYTDTLYVEVKPLFEQMLDKSKFRAYNLPGDAQPEQPGWLEMDRMWNNIYDYTNHERWLTRLDTGNPEKPQVSTFDMGVAAKLSRLTLFNWRYEVDGQPMFYYGEHMRYFEIWGTMNPDPDGSFDNWVLLGSFENKKPSQFPYGQQSREDQEAAIKGFDFIFPLENLPKVRYVRIKHIQNWGGDTHYGIEEIDLFGDPR